MFIYRERELRTMGDICEMFEWTCSVSFIKACEFIQEYDRQSMGCGIGNLTYQYGNPYFYAYKKNHPKSPELSELIERVKELETQISEDFSQMAREELVKGMTKKY